MEIIASSPLLKSFLAGSFSGTCSTLLFQPLDLVKTRLQTPARTGIYAGDMVTVFVGVLKNERLTGLWKGMTPSIARTVPGVGVYFTCLHWMSSKFTSGNPKPIEAMCLGALARSISGITLLPFTVVKTRFESGVYKYEGVFKALHKIYITEGAKGLYCGLIPTLIRDAPYSGIYLLFYTEAKALVPQSWREGTSAPPTHFACGIVAGMLASVFTQPADVIKTKIQLYPNQFQNITSVLIHIYQTAGVAGYFRGLVPRAMRRTLVTAMAWTVYEQSWPATKVCHSFLSTKASTVEKEDQLKQRLLREEIP